MLSLDIAKRSWNYKSAFILLIKNYIQNKKKFRLRKQHGEDQKSVNLVCPIHETCGQLHRDTSATYLLYYIYFCTIPSVQLINYNNLEINESFYLYRIILIIIC